MWFCSLILILAGSPLRACTGGAFSPTDFLARCISLVQIAETCRSLSPEDPDRASATRKLVGTWIDFYLEHGRQPPALFASLGQEQWIRGTGQIGRRVGEFSRQELASGAWEEILLPLHLLADPPRLFQVQACCDTLVASSTTPPVGVRAQEDLRHLLADHPRLQAEIPGPRDEPIASVATRLERFRPLLFR